MTSSDDHLRAARAGDRAALEALLRAEQPRIHAICRRITGNEADALDATQEALIAIVRGLPRFDGRSKVSTWIYRVTTNTCLDELRRRNRRPVVGLPEDEQGAADVQATAIRSVDEQVVDQIVLDRALADLPPEFRAVVVLRDLLQLDYAEIAEVLDIPPGTVRSRIARGRAHLADRLSGTNRPPADVTPHDHD